MRELNELEQGWVAGGISDFDILSISVMGGTLLGSAAGVYMAVNVAVVNIWQLFLFPIWVVAGAGIGGMMGSMLGTLMGVGGICAHHLCHLEQ